MLEERTTAFFKQNVEVLAEQLRGREIVTSDTDHRIVVTSLEPYLKEAREDSSLKMVGVRYKAMERMEPGDLWVPPVRRIRQSLVVAYDQDITGACVRLLGARAYNPHTQEWSLMPREGDIATFLGLTTYERARLVFLDNSEVLHLIRGQVFKVSAEKPGGITAEQADEQLRRLVE